jgi:cell division protein YceG involved in septum cleavage
MDFKPQILQAAKPSKIFVVKNGEGVREIANNLKAKGLIKDPIVFFFYKSRRY